ncbi:MAG: RecBCD enzyme subunit RecD [Firmicutes bacterium ADurb.Bin300]|nr:MAG: RecBCD enzyme subunit RecD [Firmicutes bacterium ADurb.Bin300]
MDKICKDIFKAIHDGKWLSINYKNKLNKTTAYWIGIKGLNPSNREIKADGLNLKSLQICELTLYVDSIINSEIVDGSYCEINQTMIDDIRNNPIKYDALFGSFANLKILNYLCDCNRLDSTPYKTDYSLIKNLDIDIIGANGVFLNDEQYRKIISRFKLEADAKRNAVPRVKRLCMNVISINTKKGLYVLAYRRLLLDVKQKRLDFVKDITICKEFSIDGTKMSINRFLDAEDLELLDNAEIECETIKDRITLNNPQINGVDDMPYLLAIENDFNIDLDREYTGIMNMYNDNTVTYPIKAFFGELAEKPRRQKNYPIALLNKKVNLDQLLAIHNALKYPVLYVQGPPGGGKTNTIINTIVAAFFNEKSVLVTSYNNHPVDSVYEALSTIEYNGRIMPFPIIRLGNNERVKNAIKQIKLLKEAAEPIKIYDATLEKNKKDEEAKTRKLTELLKNHEIMLDLEERKSAIEQLADSSGKLPFKFNLQIRQLEQVNRKLKEIGTIKDEDALSLVNGDTDELLKFLYFLSAKYIKRLNEPKYEELIDILNITDEEFAVSEFNKYLKDDENMQKFLRVFPIVATTNISAYKLGEPKPYFDMVIMDEASQCNTAISLVPIIRGESLLLVGDPQQLRPVILLDAKSNLTLKKKYGIDPEYDYIEKSVYQTFLLSDPVSDEILLSYHYRCHPKIINFNNQKYYNNKLSIKTQNSKDTALVFVDLEENRGEIKNSSVSEAYEIVDYVKKNKGKNIGIITPFVNQKNLINGLLKENGITDVSCGTVHAFQGDEKDEILFSIAVTSKTSSKTYEWLKNNKELINVATSRAKNKLSVISSYKELERLHKHDSEDDLFELCGYVKSNGLTKVSRNVAPSRALGIKPYSTDTENAFLENLNFALDNLDIERKKYFVHKEVPISHVFQGDTEYNNLFFTGRFDFVVYERMESKDYPIFAIELDGKEHSEDERVIKRDKEKNEICRRHGFELIRIPNSYARRYAHIKEILIEFFGKV